jgi:hypothetical protein
MSFFNNPFSWPDCKRHWDFPIGIKTVSPRSEFGKSQVQLNLVLINIMKTL